MPSWGSASLDLSPPQPQGRDTQGGAREESQEEETGHVDEGQEDDAGHVEAPLPDVLPFPEILQWTLSVLLSLSVLGRTP